MGKGKSTHKSSRDLKEGHGETCQCRRCRARVEALERRPLRIRGSEYAKWVSHVVEDEN